MLPLLAKLLHNMKQPSSNNPEDVKLENFGARVPTARFLTVMDEGQRVPKAPTQSARPPTTSHASTIATCWRPDW